MELCDRWGIPHSHFRGHGDGTWTGLDRRKALAYAAYQRTVCPGCGTRPDEWDASAGGDEDAYTAITHRCIGCQILTDRQKTVPTTDEGHGVKVMLIPTSVHAALAVARTQHEHH
ncbi:hypothetical protein [Streptomyces caniscabiei]|uniref:GATA-type domain-containing protein n=1 Tax=Streptomyces caniscabiei TaxID=2746961 RepID=A0ABU4MZ90_9ACTN|nr:hypothetical protein [Streptomyces caniscabiei]MDX3015206.1 hypothetical protein [Streptomyces caniscabiei]MDX3042521.1 hypothetical protein [Streptomyces caniscabiei]